MLREVRASRRTRVDHRSGGCASTAARSSLGRHAGDRADRSRIQALVTLYDRRNRVQTRSALLDDVWGIQADITTRTVDTHVKRLRENSRARATTSRPLRGVGYASSARRTRR